MSKFKNEDDSYNGKERKKHFKDKSKLSKEILFKMKSYRQYSKLKPVVYRIQTNLEKIIKKKSFSIRQIDLVTSDFENMISEFSKMNRKNLHKAYFPRITKSDLAIINLKLLRFIRQNSNCVFETIIEDSIRGNKILIQIEDMLAFEKDFETIMKNNLYKNILQRKRVSVETIFSHEKKAEELSHIVTMQFSYVHGYLLLAAIKNHININSNFTYEIVDENLLNIIQELYHLVLATYPFDTDFTPLDFSKNKLNYICTNSNHYVSIPSLEWKDKIDWLYKKLETMVAEERLLTLEEKRTFDMGIDSLMDDILIPQNGDSLEMTREKAKLEIKNPLFKAYLSYLKGDIDEFKNSIELTTNNLIALLYKIDHDKSINKKDEKE